MADETKRKVKLEVKTGLYVLRYVGSADARTAPIASVCPSAGSVDSIAIIGAPGTVAEELHAPGANLVLVVRSPGTIEVSLRPFQNSSNLDAKFSLDLLASAVEQGVSSDASRATTAAVDRSFGVERADRQPLTVEILAHVSRRGDIKPDAEGWIAGPKSPSAIEGLEVHTRGADVAVAAQFLNAANPRNWSAWVTPGSFIGTRQKASPLTGLRLKLIGGDAQRFTLEVEGLFLGSPKTIQNGSEVQINAPGGSDPLVGLRLALTERTAFVEEIQVSKIPRVRVFR